MMLPAGMGPIVVGVDGSQGSHAAVEWAAQEGHRRGLAIRLLCALGEDPVSAAERATAEGRIAAAVAAVAGVAPSVPVTTGVTTAGAAAALVAASEAASMVVTGSRGLAPMCGLLLGSVSRQVAEHADTNVVVVPGFRPMAYGEIVVGLDGAAGDEAALAYAFDDAEARHAALRVVHAYATTRARADEPGGPDARVLAELADERRHWLGDRLAPWTDKHPGVPTIPQLVYGSAVYTLATAAMHADLLVIAARGRGGFPGLRIGATCMGVLSHAQCPVVIVRGERRP